MTTIPAPPRTPRTPRTPIDVPRYSPFCGSIKAPKLPTSLGPYQS